MRGNVLNNLINANRAVRQALKLLPLFVALIALPGLLRADVTASLDRDTVYEGDTITLRITATGGIQGEQPDLTPLKKNFSVVGTSSSRRIQIINGKRSDKDEWAIELAPLGTGTIAIPPLSVRNGVTPALTLQVNEQPEASIAQAGQPVFISTEIDPPQGDTYVQQQILYTVRLYYRVPLIKGSLGDPAIDDAVVEQLGNDRQYKTTIDGQGYQVVERHYAIFPEHSGELSIGPTLFAGRTASAADQRSRQDSMDNILERMLGQRGLSESLVGGKPIRVRSDAITLTIKPRPENYTGAHWLPSQQLVLRDSWAKTPPAVRAGEPVTRTLTLEAKGLEASQLPTLQPAESDTLRVYPEQPELSNRTDGDWIYGRSEQRFTFVATQPGKLTLPEVQIDWWDSTKHRQLSAVLPAREITVEPGTGHHEPQVVTDSTPIRDSNTLDQSDSRQDTLSNEQRSTDTRYWMIGGGLMTALMLAGLVLIRKRRPPSPGKPEAASAAFTETQPGSGNSRDKTLAHTRQALESACRRNDARAAAGALLDWAAATWPQQPPRSLGALAVQVDRGADAVRELESMLYSAGNESWAGQALWDAFANGLCSPFTTNYEQADNTVPPLYPDWNRKTG